MLDALLGLKCTRESETKNEALQLELLKLLVELMQDQTGFISLG